MYYKYAFNARKYNSASKLSDCIENNPPKVIIALPTSNEVVESFEKSTNMRFWLC